MRDIFFFFYTIERRLHMAQNYKHSSVKKDRTLLKAGTSILFAIIASSHHWLHTLLIALGLTTLGANLLALSPIMRFCFYSYLLFFPYGFYWWHNVNGRKNVQRPLFTLFLPYSLLSLLFQQFQIL